MVETKDSFCCSAGMQKKEGEMYHGAAVRPSPPPADAFASFSSSSSPLSAVPPSPPPPHQPAMASLPSETLLEEEYLVVDKDQAYASGIASGIVGMLVGGPFFAVIAGFGAAYACREQPGTAVGDVARAVGDIALYSRSKFQELDRTHRFVESTRARALEARRYLQDMDQRHGLVSTAKKFFAWSFCALVGFTKEHRLLERGAEAAYALARWTASTLVARVQRQTPTRYEDKEHAKNK